MVLRRRQDRLRCEAGLFSRLTYEFAKGRKIDPRSSQSRCAEKSASHGWCYKDKIGSSRASRSTTGKLSADREGDRPRGAGQQAGGECGMLVAMVTDSMCPFCRITYKEGKALRRVPLLSFGHGHEVADGRSRPLPARPQGVAVFASTTSESAWVSVELENHDGRYRDKYRGARAGVGQVRSWGVGGESGSVPTSQSGGEGARNE